jgi:hypothetical protein
VKKFGSRAVSKNMTFVSAMPKQATNARFNQLSTWVDNGLFVVVQ